MKNFASVCIVLCFLRAISANSQVPQVFGPRTAYTDQGANDAVQPNGSMKVGYFLETQFREYFKNCNAKQFPQKDGKDVSLIPPGILNSALFNPWAWVNAPKQYTAANAFAIVSSSQSLPTQFDASPHLALDPLQDPVSMLPIGTSRVIYSSSCSGVLAGAVSSDARVKFPFEQLTALVTADYTGSSNGELGVIWGEFTSPFFALYNEQTDGLGGASYAHFLLWDWYRKLYAGVAKIPDKDPHFMLNWFNGYSLYHIHKASRSADGSIKLSADGGVPGIVSASVTASAQYQSSQQTTIENYMIAEAQNPPAGEHNSEYAQIDSVDKLVTWGAHSAIPELASPQLSSFSNLLQKGLPEKATHEVILRGIPPTLCDETLWTVNPDQTTSTNMMTLQVAGHRYISPSPLVPGCAFTIKYQPKDSVFDAAAGSVVNVRYNLETKIADKTFDTSQVKIDFSTSSYPAIAPRVFAPTPFDQNPVASGGGYTLQWKLALSVTDDPNDKIDLATPVVQLVPAQFGSCTALLGGPVGVPSGGLKLSTGGELDITLNQFVRFPVLPDPNSSTNTTCAVSMTLRFKTINGNSVSGVLPAGVNVLYPVMSVPGPTPPTGTAPTATGGAAVTQHKE